MSERIINMVEAAVEHFHGFIGWSLGRDKYDNRPHSFAGEWSDLIEFVDCHRAPKKGVYGLAGLFGNDGRRCLENALPRHFLPFDLDGTDSTGVPDAELERAIAAFDGLEAISYETASSQPGARKARFIVLLSRPITDDESRRLGAFVAGLTGVNGWDKSVYWLSQMCYLPPPHSELIVMNGAPLPVDDFLRKIPPPPPKFRPRLKLTQAPDARSFFVQNGLVLRDFRHGLHVICPWVNEHSGADKTGTAWFEPGAENGFLGGFKCQHAHCSHRKIGDVFALMGSGK